MLWLPKDQSDRKDSKDREMQKKFCTDNPCAWMSFMSFVSLVSFK